MIFENRVHETTSTAGAGPFTLLGAVFQKQTFAGAFGLGGVTDIGVTIVHKTAAEWQTGVADLGTDGKLTFTSIESSSNGSAPVIFSGGLKDVFCDVTAGAVNAGLAGGGGGGGGGSTTVPFSATIPFTGDLDMGTKIVTADVAFVPNMIGAVRNGTVAVSVKADGVHAVTFAGFVQDNTSDGWNNHANLVHRVVFFYDGLTTLPSVSITQVPTPPAAPTIGTATLSGSSVSQAFIAPANDNGGTVTGYIVTASPSGVTASGATSPIVLTGLPIGAATTQTVQAVNIKGPGAASAASNSVTIPSASVPGAPVFVSLIGGPKQATLRWTDGAANGSAITGTTITPITTPGQGAPTNTTPIPIAAGVNFAVIPAREYFEHQEYTFRHTNGAGAGAITTTADQQLLLRPNRYFSTIGVTESSVVVGSDTFYTYTGNASATDYTTSRCTTGNDFSQCQIAPNTNGEIICAVDVVGSGKGAVLFVSPNGAQAEAAAQLCIGFDNVAFIARVAGTQVATGGTAANGGSCLVKIKATGRENGTATATITAEYSTTGGIASGGFNWTLLWTLTNQSQSSTIYSGFAVKSTSSIGTFKTGY